MKQIEQRKEAANIASLKHENEESLKQRIDNHNTKCANLLKLFSEEHHVPVPVTPSPQFIESQKSVQIAAQQQRTQLLDVALRGAGIKTQLPPPKSLAPAVTPSVSAITAPSPQAPSPMVVVPQTPPSLTTTPIVDQQQQQVIQDGGASTIAHVPMEPMRQQLKRQRPDNVKSGMGVQPMQQSAYAMALQQQEIQKRIIAPVRPKQSAPTIDLTTPSNVKPMFVKL